MFKGEQFRLKKLEKSLSLRRTVLPVSESPRPCLIKRGRNTANEVKSAFASVDLKRECGRRKLGLIRRDDYSCTMCLIRNYPDK